MSEGLPIKQITIIRIITMAAGFLGALVMLLEYGFFHFEPDRSLTLSNGLLATVGVLFLLNLIRHLRILCRLGKKRVSAPN